MAELPPPTGVVPVPEQLLLRLDWRVVKRLAGQHQGDHRTVMRGAGIDVTDIRPYEPYDDVRHIDWNVTARVDEPHVREYTEDRDLTAWLLVDRSSSMAFGPAGRGKDVVVAELAVTLARLLTRGGNRVGAVLFDGAIEETVPPGTSRRHVLRLAQRVMRPARPSTAETDLAPLLRAASSMLKQRSLVFILSDFIGQPGWQRPLGTLAQRHEVVAVRMADRREEELPDVGVIVVEDAETGEQLLVDTSDPAFRVRYREGATRRERELEAEVRRAGARWHTVWTHDDLADALVRMTHTARR